MRDEGKKRTIFSRRSLLLGGVSGLMFTALYTRLIQLQLVEASKYRGMSTKNCLRLTVVPPARGIIYARGGEELAGNEDFTRLAVDDRKMKVVMSVIAQLNDGILSNPIELDNNQVKALIRRTSPNSPVPIVANLKWEDLSRIEFYRYRLDKVIIENGKRRTYRFGGIYSHVLGYVSSPTEEQLRHSNISNYQDFVMGKSGLEKIFDDSLHGVPGVKETEVDAKGKFVRDISNTKSAPGQDLHTTLHMGLQCEIAKQFVGKNGACVVLDVNSGQVLAMYSSPSFDPNQFVSGISQRYWDELLNNPDKPLINKCISGAFPPGSTFKPVTALAALIAGVDPDRKVFCNGEHKIGSHVFHCFKRSGHGDVDMRMAIAQSCNVYFYKVGQDIGVERIAHAAEILGLGSLSGLGLPFEASGVIPTKKWKKQRFKQEWMQGDTANSAIGQGYVLVTPIQLATMVARIASGLSVVPTLQLDNYSFEPLAVGQDKLQVIRDGMYMGMNDRRGNNYAHRLDNASFTLAGKTGTAQVAALSKSKGNSGLDEHGLFIGFAPFDNPKYAVAAIVEHGVWGYASALPIAKHAISYLEKNGI